MAAPNLANISTITAKTAASALGTSTSTPLSNPSASGKVFKVNTILVSNVDGTNSANVTVQYYDGSTAFRIASTILVAADSTLVVTDKNSVIYLEEGKSIRAFASANSDLEIVISYEELS